MSGQTESVVAPPVVDPLEEAIVAIRHALQGLRYGQVVITVQDGLVIQVDRTERRRLRSQRKRS